MKSLVSIFCGLVASAAIAATCTYTDGAWDTTPSSADDEIVITSGSLTWDTSLPATVASWTQTGGTVTFGTTFADATGVTVLEAVNVSGDVSLTNCTWTHKANSDKKQFRLYVKVGGNMTIETDTNISADGLGYKKLQAVNGNKDGGTQGGTYGGHGAVAQAKANWTYGSYSAPEDLGNAGAWSTCYAGGAIRLDVTGTLTLNGSIAANSALPAIVSGGRYYSGSGGSVYLNVGSIAGTGTLSADAAGELITGGGGRIAVIIHDEGADFANFDLKTQASAKSLVTGNANVGGCGTIYGETPSDKAGEGWLILKGTGTAPTSVKNNLGWADPFTYEYTQLHFAKISVLGKTKLIVNEGNTLDLTGTTLESSDAGYGIMVNGGTLKTSAEGSLRLTGSVFCNVASTIDSPDVIIDEGGVLAGREKITIPGNLTVKSGGKLETDVAAATPTHALYLDITGNLTIEEGGTVDVTGQGYTGPNSPSGQYKDLSGASYAGKGLVAGGSAVNIAPTYGSIVNPLDCGSGGTSQYANPSAGGGLIRLEIAGALTVNGSIVANGAYHQYYPGAGGSINVKAASIAGTGLVQAHGGDTDYTTASSGGRIAVRLTGEGKTFDTFTGTWDVRAGTNVSKNNNRGGTGTVYLQTLAEGENGGTLIVDGGAANAPSVAETSIGGDIEGLEFGDIIIRNKGNLVLAPNATLIVKGNFQNEATFVAGAGSTVQFAGSGESVISGDNTFVNLGCATDCKTIKFTAGSKQTVTGAMTVAGGDNKITLCSTESGTAWNLDTSAGSATLSSVAIGDCNSTAALSVTDGEDLGGNTNVTVQGSVEPATIKWSGKVDGSWSTEGNWDVRVPTKVDTVIIPANTPTATLAANAKVAALTVAGTLDVADKGITVTGDASVSGALFASSAAPIEVGGNLTISGAFTAGSSIVTLNGTAAQTVNCAEGVSFASLVVAGSAATFATDLNAASFTLGAGTFIFAKDIMVNATKFYVNGDATKKNALLCPVSEGDTWKLKVSTSKVTGATVSGSDASAGLMIVPSDSVDAGNNTNWLFNDTRLHWTGAADSDFANPANWKDGQVPTTADDVVIEGETAAVITGVTEVASLTLGLGATLTVNTNLTCNGALLVEDEGTLVANKPINVTGNLTVLDDATITHDVNIGVEQYKVEISVGGTAYFATAAKVNVKGKGYKYVNDRTTYRGPGACALNGDTNTGASYGGRGFHGSAPAPACYGSVFNPVNIGSAGGWTGNGGGAFILRVTGALTLDTTIDADGGDGSQDDSYGGTHYTGSGGSINISAASLTGSGSLRACGGKIVGSSGDRCGGGGRIAVVLTDESATLDGFSGSMIAYGGFRERTSNGSAGTIYTKIGSQNGVIRIEQNPLYIASSTDVTVITNIGEQVITNKYSISHELTDFPMADDAELTTALETLIEVQANCVLNLTADAEIADLHVFAGGKIKLNGHTLHVHHRKYNAFGHKPAESELFDDSRVDAGEGGKIIWDIKPMMMLIQ